MQKKRNDGKEFHHGFRSGLYAQHMAERGFVTIAFDPSFTGESGGELRRMASPDINTEDFLAAVDFLSNCDIVDPERIGKMEYSSLDALNSFLKAGEGDIRVTLSL